MPSRVTSRWRGTIWSAPALAAGGRLASTTTETFEVAVLPCGSVTVRRNPRLSPTAVSGVVKLGVAVVAPVNVTDVPATCDHE